jgi:taurine dioxygenase
MGITVTPKSAALGAEVTGIDLSAPLDEATVAAVNQAMLDHLVLVFPDQKFDEDAQIRFTGYFGELGKRKRHEDRTEADDVHYGVMLVTNIREDGKQIGSLPDGEMMFHSDGAYDTHPYKYTFLYGIDLPSEGGNTLFANMYAAYDTLANDIKRKLAGKRAMHHYYAGSVMKDDPVGKLSGDSDHPLVVAHEETGKTALYLSRLFTHRILDMPEDESEALLEKLFDHCEDSSLVYEHVWRPGQLVVWDNRCTNHARTDFAETERRLLRRTAVQGNAPAGAANQAG